MIAPITITLPFPPSVNAMYANRSPWRQRSGKVTRDAGGRFPTKRYRIWKRQADTLLMVAQIKPIKTPVAVSVVLHPPDARRRDCDNLLKPLLDCLVRSRVIADDARTSVVSVEAKWGDQRKPAAAVITISPV